MEPGISLDSSFIDFGINESAAIVATLAGAFLVWWMYKTGRSRRQNG